MPMPWERKGENEAGEGSKKIEELTSRFASIETATTETKATLSDITARLSKLDDVSAFIAEQRATKKKDTEEAARRAAEAARGDEDENLPSDLLSDPRSTIERVTKPQADTIKAIRARQVRQEVFNDPDNVDRYKYYSGEIRKEVDALIEGQGLDFQCNSASVANAYDTVLGRHIEEIVTGKIKTRFASSSAGTTGSGSGSGEGSGKREVKITDDIRKAARLTGFSPEEYAAMVAVDEEEGI